MGWSAKLVLQKLGKSLAKRDPDSSGTSLALLAQLKKLIQTYLRDYHFRLKKSICLCFSLDTPRE